MCVFKEMPYWLLRLSGFLALGGIIGIVPSIFIEALLNKGTISGIGPIICVSMLLISMILLFIFKDTRDYVILEKNKPKFLQAEKDEDIVYCQGKRYQVHFLDEDIVLKQIEEEATQ